MTEEHLPPRSADNASPTTVYIERAGALEVLRSYSAGHTVPSLGSECNGGADRRGLPQAYTLWHKDMVGHVQLAAATFEHATSNARQDLFALIRPAGAFLLPVEHGRQHDSKHLVTLNPNKIVRQALGMVLAVQETRHLLEAYPQLATAYFSDEPASIEPFTIHVALANAGLAYFRSGLMSVTVDLKGAAPPAEIEFWGIAFAPFVILLVHGERAPIQATRIDHWFSYRKGEAFRPKDRKVSYVIADRRELLVAKLYDSHDALQDVDSAHPQEASTGGATA